MFIWQQGWSEQAVVAGQLGRSSSMRAISTKTSGLILFAMLALPSSATIHAQDQDQEEEQDQDEPDPNIVVTGSPTSEVVASNVLTKGPEIKGMIAARNDNRVKIVSSDGTSNIVAITEATKIKNAGLFGGRSKLPPGALLNGLPVTVKTMQSDAGLVASQISFRKTDLKTANMIRNGTEQQFAEQTAATEALRGRMADIDKYNIKSTTNVYFDTGKAILSPQAKAALCNTASAADATDNALMLVVGYTDSVGSQEYNQQLSEKRASSVINYLQQACRWKPYRMLTPTGMSESDPLASNDTAEGKAQNRRVSVNILVSKSVDGL
jgi:outer membrane protein OmpA-like peptidoglycan-associated protein